jgi:hypothetical protein
VRHEVLEFDLRNHGPAPVLREWILGCIDDGILPWHVGLDRNKEVGMALALPCGGVVFDESNRDLAVLAKAMEVRAALLAPI